MNISSRHLKGVFGLLLGLVLAVFGTIAADIEAVFEDILEPAVTDGQLHLSYLDIGQGDATLIQTPEGNNILIDGGPSNQAVNLVGKILPFTEKEIDIMILTHPHADHVTGLVEVLRRYDVKNIYYSGALHTASDYIAWLQEIKKQNIPFTIIKEPLKLDLEQNLTLEFLGPLRDYTNQRVEELNNTSVITKLIYGDTSFLFTGDAEMEQELELLESDQDLSATVLQSGHHGSSSSSTEAFLELVDPEIAVISSAADNDYGHPHLKVLKRLERLGIKIMRTDLDGTIDIYSDGQNITIGG